MDPEQWRTEHTNIQGMPGPLDLRRMCNHLAKKSYHGMQRPDIQEGEAQQEECHLSRRAPNNYECGHQPVAS